MKENVKKFLQAVSKDEVLKKELEGAGSFGAMQTRLNWWLVVVGIAIAALQYWRG